MLTAIHQKHVQLSKELSIWLLWTTSPWPELNPVGDCTHELIIGAMNAGGERRLCGTEIVEDFRALGIGYQT